MNHAPDICFKLFATCQIVKGKARSAIYDLERSAFYDLPNELVPVLEAAQDQTAAALEHRFGDDFNLVATLLDQFVQKELGFYTTEPQRFPPIDFTWDSPHWITNSVIEYTDTAGYDLEQLISQLDELACPSIQLRILGETPHPTLKKILSGPFADTRVNYLELLLPYTPASSYENLLELIAAEPRIYSINVYGAPDDRIIPNEDPRFDKRIVYFKKDLRTEPAEIIRLDRFLTNINLYAEAKHYNTGLNRKVSIDLHGNIKNYLSHHKTFGNLNHHRLADIIQSPAFQRTWTITNDNVEICKDCQYRYACVNNSDLREMENKYYKIDMCGFVPETNTWT